MAPLATKPAPGRIARILRRLLSWRRHLAIALAIELSLSMLRLPAAPHVALAMALHGAAELFFHVSRR